MNTVNETINPIIEKSLTESQKVSGNKILQPVYWSMDTKGNILFDVESMREEFEYLLSQLEEHNDNSDFDWDSVE